MDALWEYFLFICGFSRLPGNRCPRGLSTFLTGFGSKYGATRQKSKRSFNFGNVFFLKKNSHRGGGGGATWQSKVQVERVVWRKGFGAGCEWWPTSHYSASKCPNPSVLPSMTTAPSSALHPAPELVGPPCNRETKVVLAISLGRLSVTGRLAVSGK